MNKFIIMACAALLALPTASMAEENSPIAFPGAEGWGRFATGGRGGRVVFVTNTEDYTSSETPIEGSLRAALQAEGNDPITIVFRTSGRIDLKEVLKVNRGNITLAGQTAPGDGICISGRRIYFSGNNYIIRYLRFRMGDGNQSNESSLDIENATNVIVDHCSLSWSVEENVTMYDNKYTTMQWCILTESLKDSNHPKGEHGYGGIWGGKNASFHHNMLANHDSRNPRFDHPQVYENPDNPARRGHVDFRNNVIFNWGNNNTYGGEGGWFNLVNNYYKQGKDSRDRKYIYDVNGIYTSKDIDYGYPELYVSGNVYHDYPGITADNLTGLYWHDDSSYEVPSDAVMLSSPLSLEGPSGQDIYTSTHSAYDAFEAVCGFGGASDARDAVDERAVSGAKAGTGAIIDLPSDVGGYPEYTASAEETEQVKDTDGDGMPDWFETEFGLDPSDASDGITKNLDRKGRYTNLEMYLHYLVRDIVASQTAGSTYTQL